VFWVVDVQVRDALPEPKTLVGEIAPQVRPVGAVSLRLTTPLNPFTAVIVMVPVIEEPPVMPWDVAEIVKSWKSNVALVEWDSEPLVPVIDRT
jgi:hypothetical protein